MMYFVDGYISHYPYGWRGSSLARRAANSLGRFRGDPDLTKFYINALCAAKNKMAKSRRRLNNEN